MKKMQVTARVPAKDDAPEKVATIEVDAPETAEEAVQMFGGEAVNSNAIANWRVTLQATARAGLKRGEDQAALQARLGNAKMGVAVTKGAVDPEAAFLAKYQAATPAERKAMMKKLQAMAAA